MVQHPTIALPPTASIIENRTFAADNSRSFGVELLAKFMELGSANVKADVSWHRNNSFSAVDHEVRAYNGPFAAASLHAITQIPAVKKHMDGGMFGKRSVYIISGLRVAKESITITDDKGSKPRPRGGFLSWAPFRISGPPSLEAIVLDFLRSESAKAQNLRSLCDELVKKLTRDENDEVQEIPDGVLSKINTADMSAHFNHDIFDALQSLSECNPKSHELSLTEGGADIRVLVPSRNMELWQEFCLRTYVPPLAAIAAVTSLFGEMPRAEYKIRNNSSKYFSLGMANLLQASFRITNSRQETGCFLRRTESSSALHPLRKAPGSDLECRSYDSDLMRIGWTSEKIWFMPDGDGEELRETDGDRLPLFAYLTFPFGILKNSPTDILLEDFLVHRFPRIFDIGVLLLEIGFGKPFRRGKKRDMVAQVNINHKMAKDEHCKMESLDWDGFLNKRHAEKPKPIGPGVAKAAKPSTTSDPKKGILARRKIFYKNVVKPPAWLAKEGFKAQTGKISYIGKKLEAPQPGLPKTLEQPEPEDVFHSFITPQNWAGGLKKISELIARKRR
ncbi:hypothetical protein GGR54DRAFT_638316 [Hypoxylon sp. NC1633]|nr:hypothetical protein GGR54DRAFT_638316 [Hypoxylon sp. NC1633]